MYALAHSHCFGCGRLMSYNPLRVPSIPHPKTGERQPICLECVNRVNPKRIKNGLDPIVPHPDAYEPIDGNELP